jgi:quaternary ammonium compound-resistance protein SugE
MKEKNTAWILLIIAGLLEIVWAYTMKLSHGFTVLWPSVITIVILIVSFFMLAKAVDKLGIGLSYAVFTGIGVVGTTVISIFVLGEGASPLKLVSLGVLIVGILGLKLCDKEGKEK